MFSSECQIDVYVYMSTYHPIATLQFTFDRKVFNPKKKKNRQQSLYRALNILPGECLKITCPVRRRATDSVSYRASYTKLAGVFSDMFGYGRKGYLHSSYVAFTHLSVSTYLRCVTSDSVLPGPPAAHFPLRPAVSVSLSPLLTHCTDRRARPVPPLPPPTAVPLRPTVRCRAVPPCPTVRRPVKALSRVVL